MMSTIPDISIIMPVYNASKYLRQAIDSILQQTFKNFEFIIINDGSFDQSEFIIQSFTDERIRYIKNKKNQGLAYSLNRGIQQAVGNYIARMDADDISIPERLEQQKKWLDEYINTGIVASVIQLINEKNEAIGYWKADQQALQYAHIKNTLPKENCVAHPSVMGRTSIFKKYLYAYNQKDIEDYDFWLRLISDDIIIEKINIPLLQYRVHDQSVTSKYSQKEKFYFILFRCKKTFLLNKIKSRKKINSFDIKVFRQMAIDLAKGSKKCIKRKIKHFFS